MAQHALLAGPVLAVGGVHVDGDDPVRPLRAGTNLIVRRPKASAAPSAVLRRHR